MTTSIGWTWVPDGKGGSKTGETWNPQVGCLSVSPACHNCYAAGQAHRSSGEKPMVKQHHGLTKQAKDKDGKPMLDAEGRKLPPHWNGQVNRVPHLLAQPLRWRDPRGVFVCSMSDLFFDVSTEDARRWIAAIFGVMAAIPQHTFMVLTKRPENAARWFAWLDAQAEGMEDEAAPARVCMGMAVDVLAGDLATPAIRDRIRLTMRRDDLAWPLPGVWVGVTAEDQKHADLRVPVLLELPAAVRFVSYEPALGPVDWSAWLPRRDDRLEDERCPACDGDGVEPGSSCPSLRPDHDAVEKGEFGPECAECGDAYLDDDLCRECGGTGYIDLTSLDWLICGGESGDRARPMHPDWARSARDQCKAAGVPFYFKQWGAWMPVDEPEWTHAVFPDGQIHSRAKLAEDARTSDVGDLECVIEDCDGQTICNVGAKLAGRELDGRFWDGFPEVTP